MKHIGFVKNDTLVSMINWIGIPICIAYIACMTFLPIFIGKGSWIYLQNVWDRWQTINAGFLALISSLIAFNISKFRDSQQRRRQFVAARAFLPHALSELTSYCRASSIVLCEAYERTTSHDPRQETPLLAVVLELPTEYKDVFRNCIGFAESEVADNLATILIKLQIHNSRIKELERSFSSNSHTVITKHNVMSYLFSLGQLQAQVNKLFGFSRSEEDFSGSALDWSDYKTAYFNLNISVDDIPELEEFTKRAVLRVGGTTV
jgi:hypothetical protein